jgi:hypothetical protein
MGGVVRRGYGCPCDRICTGLRKRRGRTSAPHEKTGTAMPCPYLLADGFDWGWVISMAQMAAGRMYMEAR